MEGLATQLQLLTAALQPLDLSRSVTEDPEVVSELQVTLARATALAQWAVVNQQRQEKTKCTSRNGSAPQQPQLQPSDKVSQRSNIRSPDAALRAAETSPQHRTEETLLSISAALHVTVDELRRWNPQLPPALLPDEVLPANTYLKVKQPLTRTAAAPSTHPLVSVSPSTTPSASQSMPRLAAPAATSRSAARSSNSRGSDPSRPSATPTPTAAHTRTSAPRLHSHSSSSSGSANAPASTAAANVNASVASTASGGSPGRLSLWGGDSGRGASHSPQVPEPSLPRGDPSADPPHCAPAPMMLGMVEVAAAEADAPPSGEFYLPGAEASPSPERQAGELCEGTDPLPPPPPPAPIASLSTCTSPTPELRRPQPHDGGGGQSPRRASVGASSSATSTREIRTRGTSPSPSNSVTALSVERHSPSTPQPSSTAPSPTKASAACQGGAATAAASATATSAAAPADLPSVLHFPANSKRLAPEALTDSSPASPPAASEEPAEVPARGNAAAREPSVSLSVLSPCTSGGGEERDSAARNSLASNAVAAPDAASPVFVTSPSLEAPSSTSSASPMRRAAPQKQEVPSAQQQEKVDEMRQNAPPPASAADSSVDRDVGLDFSTPIQQQRRRPPQREISARRPSAERSSADVLSPSSETSSAVSSNVSFPGDENDVLEDEVEDTPSTRIPAMLGRHGCSPPPQLNRARGAGVHTAGQAKTPAVARTLVKSPPTRHPAEKQRTETAAVAAKHDAPSSKLPQPSAAAAAAATEAPANDTEQYSGVSDLSPSPSPQPKPQSDSTAVSQSTEAQALDVADAVPTPPPLPSLSKEEHLEEVEVLGEEEDRDDDSNNREEEVASGMRMEEDDYDTLEGIAAAYKLTVATIVEWNPYLKKYAPTEPLPPDLPIVLPMSDDDEDGGDDDEDVNRGVGAMEADDEEEEGEFYTEEEHPLRRRHSSTPRDTFSFTSENSPAPIPPPRY